ncbi:MAG: hypothetical protein LBF82_03645 [Lactobacillales bacterium]|jgi:hypothetical protein|nr:hypothetical protein [Lactobacillales bacterium]
MDYPNRDINKWEFFILLNNDFFSLKKIKIPNYPWDIPGFFPASSDGKILVVYDEANIFTLKLNN